MQVYLDHAATTRISAAVMQAMCDAMQTLVGNPSSVHAEGQKAAAALFEARYSVAATIGADVRETYFTSGGTEANATAVHIAAAEMRRTGKTHIITSQIEHPSVYEAIRVLEGQGFSVLYAPVSAGGLVDYDWMLRELRDETGFVSVMYVNNELGTVQPVTELGAACRERGILFHTDAVQAVGTLPIDVNSLCADVLSFSAHKLHGPRGIGALYCRHGIYMEPLLRGGAQEMGKRAGTENVPAALGFAKACEEAVYERPQRSTQIHKLRACFLAALAGMEGISLNGDAAHQLPAFVNLQIEGVQNEVLLAALDAAGIFVSAGSACAAGALEPSRTLQAIGLTETQAKSCIRVTIGEENTEEEMQYAAQTLRTLIARLRK